MFYYPYDWKFPTSRVGQELPLYHPIFLKQRKHRPVIPVFPSIPDDLWSYEYEVRVQRALNRKVNIEEMDAEGIKKAHLIKASSIFDIDNLDPERAQKYLRDNGLGEYEIDAGKSNHNYMSVKDGEGNYKGVLRGTNVDAFKDSIKYLTRNKTPQSESEMNMIEKAGRFTSDLSANIRGYSGFIRSTKQYKEAKKLAQATNPDELITYSKGGSIGYPLGNELGIPTTNFNPFFGISAVKDSLVKIFRSNRRRIIRSQANDAPLDELSPEWLHLNETHIQQTLAETPQFRGDVKHIVYQTEGDIASTHVNTKDFIPKLWDDIELRRISPLEELRSSVNPLSLDATTHDLDNFIKNGKRIRMSEKQKKYYELEDSRERMDALEAYRLHKEWKASPYENSYSQFRNYIDDNRERAGISGHWDDAFHREFVRNGGRLTPEEEALYKTNSEVLTGKRPTEPPKKPAVSKEEGENYIENPEPERQKFKETVEQTNDLNEYSHAMSGKSFRSQVLEGFSPTAVGSGMVAGWLGNKAVSKLDPHHKMGQYGDTAVSGGIAGGLMAGTGFGGATSVPEFATGAVAGLATYKGVTSGLEKLGVGQTASQVTGSTVGGAVAGATAVGTGALLGAEFAPATLGASVIVGAGIGAGAYLWEKYHIGRDIAKGAKAIGHWFKHL